MLTALHTPLSDSSPGNSIVTMRAELSAGMNALSSHRVFQLVRNFDDLRLFMRWHVFAVWDFMSLVKRLQVDLTCTSLPWMPPAHPKAARLMNEIVLGEESDETLTADHASHFDLYLGAMREVGAEPIEINLFLEKVRGGHPVDQALTLASVPPPVAAFVLDTLRLARHAHTHEVLGSFFYGRENVIPKMFSALLAKWTIDEMSVPTFVYYLKRHIELDGDSHGPAAEAIIADLVGDEPLKQFELLSAALAAVASRLRLWDALAEQLTVTRSATFRDQHVEA